MTSQHNAVIAAPVLPTAILPPPALDDVSGVVAMLNRASQPCWASTRTPSAIGSPIGSRRVFTCRQCAPGAGARWPAGRLRAPMGRPTARSARAVWLRGSGHTRRGLGSYLLGWLAPRAQELTRQAPRCPPQPDGLGQ